MVDLTTMVRAFPGPLLRDHIFGDKGGHSLDSLRNLVGATRGGSCKIYPVAPLDITNDHLRKYGPALVHQFRAHEDFTDPNLWRYVGEPKGDFVGHHAMVMIGVRTEGTNDRRFLLQNWWKTSQFVEMDADYLENCCAAVAFVAGSPCTQAPAGRTFAFFAETASDSAEMLCEERGAWTVTRVRSGWPWRWSDQQHQRQRRHRYHHHRGKQRGSSSSAAAAAAAAWPSVGAPVPRVCGYSRL